MILLDRVTKVYPGDKKPALDDVSLHIGPNDFVFLVGKSGAGKSTLIKMITKEEVDKNIKGLKAQAEEIFGFDSVVNKYLSNYIHDLNRSVFPKGEENVLLEVQFGNKDYRAILEKIPVDSLNDTESVFGLPKGKEYFVTVTLEDITDLNFYIRENEEQKLVSGLIYFDNYEEVMQRVDTEQKTQLMAKVESTIFDWVNETNGILVKEDRDTYVYIFEQRNLEQIKENKFAIYFQQVFIVYIFNEYRSLTQKTVSNAKSNLPR